MSTRTRKFLGVLACFVFLTVYCLIAMAVGGEYVPGLSPGLQLAVYVVGGLLWLPPVMAIIRWMARPA